MITTNLTDSFVIGNMTSTDSSKYGTANNGVKYARSGNVAVFHGSLYIATVPSTYTAIFTAPIIVFDYAPFYFRDGTTGDLLKGFLVYGSSTTSISFAETPTAGHTYTFSVSGIVAS